MSAADHPSDGDRQTLKAIPNRSDGTVTFSSRRPENVSVPATEWLTVAAEDLVDLQAFR